MSEEEQQRIFNHEIARELLLEVNPDTDDALINELLNISANPWDAPFLYQLMKVHKVK